MGLDIDELIKLGRVGEIRVSPDGTWIAAVVQRPAADDGTYVSDLWRVPLDGGPALQLTRSDCKDTAPRFRSDGALGFLSNRNPRSGAAEPGDDQRTQIWLLPAGAGEPTPVTDEPLGVTEFAFAGDAIVMLAEVVPGAELAAMRKAAADRAKHGPTALHYQRGATLRHWNDWLPYTALHLIHRAADGTRRDLTPTARHQLRGQLHDQHLAISPDHREACVLWAEVGEHRLPVSTLRRYDLATGGHTELGAAPRVMYAQPQWSADGRTVAAVRVELRAQHADKHTLWKFAVGGDAAGEPIAPAWEAYFQLHGFTPDGSAVVCTADHEGETPVYRIGLGGAVERITAATAAGSHDQVRLLPDGRAALVRSTQLHPPEPFVVELAVDATPRPLATLSGFSRDRGAAIADVESQWTEGDGGERIQYFVVKPRGVVRPPVLFWIHGGPVSQFTDGWHWRWNTMAAASAGYAVVLPNPRGSTGRGQAFMDAVFGNNWGAACYRDLVAVADAVAVRPDLDGARMAAMGGSFGGYMVNWIGAQGHRFRAIVSHAGIFALRTFHGTTDYPSYFAMEMGGPPWDDAVDYARYSPDTFAARWKTPVLIIHGEKDYRVPISEALLLYEALDARGVDVELLAFPDEGHWIQRPRNARVWYRTWLDFVGARITV